MRIRADEHVAKAIVAAVRDIALAPGWQIDSVVEAGQSGSSDVHWITSFMTGGGNAILSADRDFLENPPQVDAVFRTGAKVIHLPPKWGQAKGRIQAAHILMWWGRIEECITLMKARECFRPQWNVNESGLMQKIPINFQAAQKKLKKAKGG